jgi:hypothetical protein
LSVPKFTGREDPDAYLEWAEQCDQIFRVHDLSDRKRVNLPSVEFLGYALTWWNQIQENQLVLGRAPIDTWAEMKQVMRRRFVPSSYQRDLRNKLQNLKQGTKSVDDYYKEMELLLIRSGIREDAESKMARFLHGLNAEISGFVEMFPYNNLQDLVDQAMRTERKIQQEKNGKGFSAVPWHQQQSGTSFSRVEHQEILYPILLRRQHNLQLHQPHELKASVQLRTQGQHQLHPLLIVEILSATSAKDVDILLLNVLAEGQ